MTSDHVLIAIGSVVPPERFPGPCTIRGQVIHVWSGSIAVGTRLELTRTVATEASPGLDDWSDWGTVRNARYLDAQVEGSGDFHSLVRGGAVFLQSLPAGVARAADPVASAANLAVGSSIAGVGCFPFAVLGVIFSFKTFHRARESGRAIPGRALFALMLSLFVIGAGGFLAVLVATYERTRDAASKAIETRLSGRRASATLDRETACDLVREQVLAGTFGAVDSDPKVACAGPVIQKDNLGELRNVDAEFVDGRDHLTACFARTARWFVTGVVGAGNDCPAISVPPSQASDDAGRAVEEKKIRQLVADTYQRADIDAFTSSLRQIRDNLRAEPRSERPCGGLDTASFARSDRPVELRPAYVDASLFSRDDAKVEDLWPFLTSDGIREVLGETEPRSVRAKDVTEIRRRGGPYLVVYESAERVSPEVVKKKGILEDDFSYRGGRFDGWLVVADSRTGKSVCAGKLAFASSHDVKYKSRGMSSEESRVRESVMGDLEEQFKTQATDAMRRISNGKLRLGYRLLE